MNVYFEKERLSSNRYFCFTLFFTVDDQIFSFWYYKQFDYNKRLFFKSPIKGFLYTHKPISLAIIPYYAGIESFKREKLIGEYSEEDIRTIIKKSRADLKTKDIVLKALY